MAFRIMAPYRSSECLGEHNYSVADTVAIIGAGPAGCALACFLREKGLRVVLYDSGQRPSLLVGESLIPAAIPHIRKLGIEDAVRSISTLKPGAVLKHVDGSEVAFVFRDRGEKAPGYAYNVPRSEFDALLKQRAVELGVELVQHKAQFVTDAAHPTREIALSEISLRAAGRGPHQHPEYLIDCTGRTRLFAKLLGIGAVCGKRNDVAYFSHYDGFCNAEFEPGQVVISVLKRGWSWSIPFRHAAKQFGDTKEERLKRVLQSDPLLSRRVDSAKRISPVMSYSNYQQMSTRGSGPGWALVGDAYGFVDPMLSPGVFMALESASLFARHSQVNRGRLVSQSYSQYAAEMMRWHGAWQEVIEYFYDGRMVNLAEAGKSIVEECARFSPSRLADWHIRRVIGDLVSGVATRSRYNRSVLAHSARFLVDSTDEVARLAVQK